MPRQLSVLPNTAAAPASRLMPVAPLTRAKAFPLAALFRVLASDTRLLLLHALSQSGELPAGELARRVGMRPQAVSNQLQRMLERGIVVCRRDGAQIIYRIEDPCVTGLLEQGFCLLRDAAKPRAVSRP